MNPDYQKISCVPIEISMRDKIGRSLELDAVSTADEVVATLFDQADSYRESIEEAMKETLFNPRHSAEVAARYIIKAVRRENTDEYRREDPTV